MVPWCLNFMFRFTWTHNLIYLFVMDWRLSKWIYPVCAHACRITPLLLQNICLYTCLRMDFKIIVYINYSIRHFYLALVMLCCVLHTYSIIFGTLIITCSGDGSLDIYGVEIDMLEWYEFVNVMWIIDATEKERKENDINISAKLPKTVN